MKSVGIITLYETDNYGTLLQCMALKKSIEKVCDHKVYVLSHKDMVPIVNGFSGDKLRNGYDERIKKFSDFLAENVGITPMDSVSECDYYVVGSDTVWWLTVLEDYPLYFLDFVKNGKRISYAPSLGTCDYSDFDSEIFKKYIPKFDFLSVREPKAVDYIRQFTNSPIEAVLDPTLLLTAQEYEPYEVPIPYKDGEYILVYLIYDESALNTYMLNLANRLAKKYSLKVVHFVYNMPDYMYGEKGSSFAFSGPGEFLSYFKKARLVLTNSFHGTIFSIIYRKAFYSGIWDKSRNKIAELCDRLGLSHRILKPTPDISQIDMEPDYGKTEALLEIEREKSYEYLKNALK